MPDLLSLAALADEHHLLSTAQVIGCGIDNNAITRMVRAGDLRRIRRGLFVLARHWPNDPQTQHRLEVIAVIGGYNHQIAASHHSAALLHALPIYGCDLRTVRTVRIGAGRSTAYPSRPGRSGLHINEPVDPSQIQLVDGIKCCSAALAGLQIAIQNGIESGVVTIDAALHGALCTKADLATALASLHRRPGMRNARRAVELADGQAESPGESRLRLALQLMGYAVESQVAINRAGAVFARVDFFLREYRVIIEFDGAVKYRTEPGNDGREQLLAEKVREDRLRSAGFEVVRVVWTDLDRPELIRQRVAAAIQRARVRGPC